MLLRRGGAGGANWLFDAGGGTLVPSNTSIEVVSAELMALTFAPAEFAGLGAGQWFEAIVERDRRTRQVRGAREPMGHSGTSCVSMGLCRRCGSLNMVARLFRPRGNNGAVLFQLHGVWH